MTNPQPFWWATVHAVIVTVTVTACSAGILALVASNFDQTELMALGGIGILQGAREAVRYFKGV